MQLSVSMMVWMLSFPGKKEPCN